MSYRYNQAKLFRDGVNPMVSGVCSGLARYLDINPLWVRGGAVALFLVTPTAVALGYVMGVLFLRKQNY
jgi:phage shock protein PspC (stress-responsive transcriptional regulator)